MAQDETNKKRPSTSGKLAGVDVLTDRELTVRDDIEAGEPGDETGGLWPVDRLRPVVEALLFASGDPLSAKRICELIDGPTPEEALAALADLGTELRTRGIRLVEVAGGWQLRTAPEHHAVVKRLFKQRPQRLTRAAVETLAIVAYRQPCTRSDIEAIRGVDCGAVLETLVERRLLRIQGRRDVPGRPLVYGTTKDFLEVFGLKDLKSLPTLAELGDDIRDLADKGAFYESDGAEADILPLEEHDSVDPEATAEATQASRPSQAPDQEGGHQRTFARSERQREGEQGEAAPSRGERADERSAPEEPPEGGEG